MFGIYLLGLAFVYVWGKKLVSTWSLGYNPFVFKRSPQVFASHYSLIIIPMSLRYIYICFSNGSFSWLFCIFDGYALLFVVKFDDGHLWLERRSHGSDLLAGTIVRTVLLGNLNLGVLDLAWLLVLVFGVLLVLLLLIWGLNFGY